MHIITNINFLLIAVNIPANFINLKCGAYAIAIIGSKTRITATIIAASTNWKLGNKILVQHVWWRYCVLPGVSSCGFNLVDCQLLVLSSNAISNHVLRPMPVKPFSDYSPCTLLLRLTLSLCLHY